MRTMRWAGRDGRIWMAIGWTIWTAWMVFMPWLYALQLVTIWGTYLLFDRLVDNEQRDAPEDVGRDRLTVRGVASEMGRQYVEDLKTGLRLLAGAAAIFAVVAGVTWAVRTFTA